MQRERSVQLTQQSSEQARQEREYAERERQARYAQEREAQRLAEERETRRITEEKQARQIAEAEARQLAEKQKLEACQHEVKSLVNKTLTDQGYMPPEPSPLVMKRALNAVSSEVRSREADPMFRGVIRSLEREVDARCFASNVLLEQITKNLATSPGFLQKIQNSLSGIHQSIHQATVSVELPLAAPTLQNQMREIEVFLAKDWTQETHRGVMAVHVDKLTNTTIIQIGVAAHGPVYVTIPELLPEAEGLKSIEEILKRLAPFTGTGDPMAIIDGSHQRLNYNEIFRKVRVYRAPSGNTSRLARNLKESLTRERLSADNTVILNSAPRNEAEYLRIFPKDLKAQHWHAWGAEAQEWSETVLSKQFAVSPEASQGVVLSALTQAKNVIVIVAHCDGDSIFMPEPPPTGSIVTADYLREHQEDIAANAPFVYLFSCRAGDQSNLKNFASTLLECGASGVIASQADVGSAEGRVLLDRVLDESRGEPPLDDYFKAMQAVDYRDMEVFIA